MNDDIDTGKVMAWLVAICFVGILVASFLNIRSAPEDAPTPSALAGGD